VSYTDTKTERKFDDAQPGAPPAIFKSGSNPSGADTRIGVGEHPANLKFERQDWTLFRTVEGLQQKAGVPATRLRRLIIKELADNSLDTGSSLTIGPLDGGRFFVADDGPGLDGTPEEIAELFSIRRPMRSTKLLRLPKRGAIGNGLRVVAGAVLASEGSLTVITRNHRIELRPQADGSTAVVQVMKVDDHPVGTRVEIGFGPALPNDPGLLKWAHAARAVASIGKAYEGRSSPFWYDAAQFHELLLACGAQPVRSLVAQLDGCTGGKAGEIVTSAGLDRMACKDVDRQQATRLLVMARKQTRPVNPERLGRIGPSVGKHHTLEWGTVELGSSKPLAKIPYIVEAWARKEATGDKVKVDLLINRSPIVTEVSSWRDKDCNFNLDGSGLRHFTTEAPKKGAYDVLVNLTTPYCPIISDGKAPNLQPFINEIMIAVATAMRKAQRTAPKDKKQSQKDVVLDNLDEAIANASGDGEFRFNERQLFYQLRPIVLEETGQELLIGNFKRVLTDYENENGEIDDMYREPRGSIYHPHAQEDIPLGTLMVEDYERPLWTFNKLIYIEKEGFSEALKADGWPERHDCALMSSKGFSTRAARDLVDKLAGHDEPILIFCVHDADAFGTMIYQTFQEATRARGARKIRIVNLGLEAWEAVDADLEVENVEPGEQHKAVARYVVERKDGKRWEEWLQTHRVELNTLTTPEFIEWLDAKMADYDRLIPPPEILEAELAARIENKLRASIAERILREAAFENQVAEAIAAIEEQPTGAALAEEIKDLFDQEPDRQWRDHIEVVAKKASS
jgi:hypothetical protein